MFTSQHGGWYMDSCESSPQTGLTVCLLNTHILVTEESYGCVWSVYCVCVLNWLWSYYCIIIYLIVPLYVIMKINYFVIFLCAIDKNLFRCRKDLNYLLYLRLQYMQSHRFLISEIFYPKIFDRHILNFCFLCCCNNLFVMFYFCMFSDWSLMCYFIFLLHEICCRYFTFLVNTSF